VIDANRDTSVMQPDRAAYLVCVTYSELVAMRLVIVIASPANASVYLMSLAPSVTNVNAITGNWQVDWAVSPADVILSARCQHSAMNLMVSVSAVMIAVAEIAVSVLTITGVTHGHAAIHATVILKGRPRCNVIDARVDASVRLASPVTSVTAVRVVQLVTCPTVHLAESVSTTGIKSLVNCEMKLQYWLKSAVRLNMAVLQVLLTENSKQWKINWMKSGGFWLDLISQLKA